MSITIRVIGGLGNQMFQYAAGLSLARHLNTDLVVDASDFNYYALRPFLLDNFNITGTVIRPVAPGTQMPTSSSPIVSVLKKFIPEAAKPALRKMYHQLKPVKATSDDGKYQEETFYFEDRFFDTKSPSYVVGDFQSERYFKTIEQEIRTVFTLKNPLTENSQKYLQAIKDAKVPVSLHVRRGDYVAIKENTDKHGVMSPAYYTKAIEIIRQMFGDDVHFFIFSDDSAFVTEEFKHLPSKTIVTGNDNTPFEDMFLMSQCNHYIVANSTFSWWGAWLNTNADKKVIAPRWWFSRNAMKTINPMDLYPEGWMIL